MYQLHYQGALVYVGKADNLRARLTQHKRKIAGRRNIHLADVAFKCLYVHRNWTALAPEDSLIKYYRAVGTGECTWNGNGFGPHDPGRTREKTNKPPDGFDAQYPIRDDWKCDWIQAGKQNTADLLKSLKSRLPFLLRYQTAGDKSPEPHPDYSHGAVLVPDGGMSARDLLRLIVRTLPGWQATIFPSHMILYKEAEGYTHGEIIRD